MIRVRVRSGIECEAAELLSTAETVPGVKPRCSATAFRVTWFSRLRGARLPFIFDARPAGPRDPSDRSGGGIVSQLASGTEAPGRPSGRRRRPPEPLRISLFSLDRLSAVSLNLQPSESKFVRSLPQALVPPTTGLSID